MQPKPNFRLYNRKTKDFFATKTQKKPKSLHNTNLFIYICEPKPNLKMSTDKKIRVLTIQFDAEISSQEIVWFRGAVLKSLGDNADLLYHNHIGNHTNRYAYPLIQYKRIQKKAAVMGIGKGIEVISQLLSVKDFNYQIGNRNVQMQIDAVKTYDTDIVITKDTTHPYRLHNWLPLNSENYRQYQESNSIVERIQMLERVLVGNILSFLKGLDLYMEGKIDLHITDIIGQKAYTYKNVKMMAFNIEFKTNIQLPQYVGIGKSASVGCGVLTIVK